MIGPTEIARSAAEDLAAIRSKRPLIHSITNYVVMNETANAILCLGALPVMAHAIEEVEEMASIAGAVVLNIGTLTPELVDSMVLAGQAANAAGVPVVLDPVGAGATRLRTEACERLLAEVDVAVVRGNAGEIAILSGADGEVRGVESIGTYDVPRAAAALARRAGCVVAVTGAIDYVTDGRRAVSVSNGHPLMATITGSGCMSTTMVASFAAVQPDALLASAEGLAVFGIAGEGAAERASGPGSFHVGLYDELAALTAESVVNKVRVAEVYA
ncbi:MAG: hydroxyethylthiazole kinase [Coriobacteriia bacterium]|nr:hydroxyethylthiazole kinase [Coriobacteriia bacterium]